MLSRFLSDGPGLSLLLLLISLPILLFLLRLVSLPLLSTAGSLLLLRLVSLPLLSTAFLILFSLFFVTGCLLLYIKNYLKRS